MSQAFHQLHIRENELKLDILTALARSEQALAQLIEEVVHIRRQYTSMNDGNHDELLHEMMLLGKYQQVLAEKILKIRLRQRKQGEPGACWLSERCQLKTK